ncbi:hypothetical protein EPA93_30375 [Ktedonosporobacter rubrisoli]|uniref:Adhesin domain-containing protein n=1 Tax=Ktedonosporobacter rubrisoli TaxID=2509675 RepID=A0A4P6JWH9_KTERU|nr:hypothetical protein [Ktedonosporobacter rubrisoli]QBD80057.1 hypothetical protein EPA93_30375 [Ktedonosporobacter rubrisoli]
MGSKKAFTQENTQQIPLSSLSTLAQMQICNKIGDVTITVDPAATATTVATKKIVHAENQQMADQELKNIVVQVQPPGSITNTLTCAKPRALGSTAPGALAANGLIVNVTLPDNNGGLIHNSSNAVNIAITLPEKVLSANGPSLLLDVEAPVGNISVNGLSGVLTIQGSSGNVTVKHAILAAGSHIETGQGNVTFDGLLAAPTPPDAPARYILQSEEGKIDVTLPESTNVILDANTNVGTINSDFPLYNVENNKGDGPVNFRGPLNSTTSPQSKAVLMLDVSTGSIALHKAQV